jgi:cell division septal protein FtsQ
MSSYLPPRARPPWIPWVKVALVALGVLGAGYGILEIGQRYLGLQKLTIEQVTVTGCKGERLEEVQVIARELCQGKPLFWFDAGEVRRRVEDLRWVRGLLIRRDPPDRLALVVEERRPLLWLVRPSGVYLVSDDGVVLDRVNPSNATPIPVVSDPRSQTDAALVQLIRVATRLRDSGQKDFFERIVELRWGERGPAAFLEGLQAPLYLSRVDPAKNIPNFQGLYLDRYANSPDLAKVRYFDLRWDDEVAVGEGGGESPAKEK